MLDSGRELQSGDALVVVDVQKDFCPGGALPIEDGHAVVPVLKTVIGSDRMQDMMRHLGLDMMRRMSLEDMSAADARIAALRKTIGLMGADGPG
jgi:hypothetical protein